MATPALWLAMLGLATHDGRRPDPVGDFLVVAYLIAVSTSLCTLGFLALTAPSARWRRLAVARAVVIAGALGLVAPIVSLLVAALGAPVLVPLFRTVPWLASTLMHGAPGLVLGGLALVIARAWPGRVLERHAGR